jgi:hypothetical protein
LVRGLTVVVVAGGEPSTVDVTPPGFDVTVYFVIVLLEAGAVHDTVACALPRTAETLSGGPGVPGMTAFDGSEAGPVPELLVAVTVKV